MCQYALVHSSTEPEERAARQHTEQQSPIKFAISMLSLLSCLRNKYPFQHTEECSLRFVAGLGQDKNPPGGGDEEDC